MSDQGELVAHRRLTIMVSRRPEAISLRLYGDLDMENAPTLDDQLADAESSDAPSIVLDLSQLDFIDSSGLRTVLRAAQRSCGNSHRLAVRRGTGQVAKLFELTAIDRSLNLLD